MHDPDHNILAVASTLEAAQQQASTTYNSKQQLQQIVKGKAGKVEQTIRYVYDPLGRRIGKK